MTAAVFTWLAILLGFLAGWTARNLVPPPLPRTRDELLRPDPVEVADEFHRNP